MLVEFEPDDFSRVRPLYQQGQIPFPLILSVIEKKQKGRIFADRREDPASAVVLTDFGFMAFLGSDQNEAFNAGVANLFASAENMKASYLLWYAPPVSWQEKLDALTPDPVRRRERMRFKFLPERADFLNDSVECPAGHEMKCLNAELIPKTEKFGLDIGSRFWSSVDDFLRHGLSVCIVHNDEIVCLCYSACVADGFGEMDMVTEEEYRGRGLATLVAQGFAKECIKRGIVPGWDCFANNLGSRKIAEKLCFAEPQMYDFYSFNIPLDFRR